MPFRYQFYWKPQGSSSGGRSIFCVSVVSGKYGINEVSSDISFHIECSWDMFFSIWLTTVDFALICFTYKIEVVFLNHGVFWIGTKCLFWLIWKIRGIKIYVLETPREKSSIIFLIISSSTVILVFSWIAQEYLCRYPQITRCSP